VANKSIRHARPHSPEEKEKRVNGGWLRTKIVTTMDPNGLFYIQSKVPD